MVTVTVEQEDLEQLLGARLPTDLTVLNEVLSQVKCEATRVFSEETGVEELSLENKDTNRTDLWSPEGVARALRGFMGLPLRRAHYEVTSSSGVSIKVDRRLEGIRPYIACSVVKDVHLSDAAIRGLMHLQDKLDGSYGRGRRRSSIGLYEFDLIRPPLTYGAAKPDEISFVPLGTNERMTLREIVARHPKGIEYGHIVEPNSNWPILLDSNDNVLSFPPIINSNDLGRITPKTRNVLVEVTGTSLDTVLNAVMMISVSLADRGGRIHSAIVQYPYGNQRRAVTPMLKTRRMRLSLRYASEVLGLELSSKQTIKLLRKAGFEAQPGSLGTVDIVVPCYRLDVMHAVDIVEDIGIAYGLNRMRPRWPGHATIGGVSRQQQFTDLLREIMIGLGYQEVLTFTLSNPDKLFAKMNVPPEIMVELENPRVQTLTCLRNWLVPSLMEILSANVHVTYPQRVFEVGDCAIRNGSDIREIVKLAALSCHAGASFTEARAAVDALLMNLGVDCRIAELNHGSFIEGRIAAVLIEENVVGMVGEVAPQVLENWGIQNPCVAFELNASMLEQEANR
jgi:phenylalanyl-tRNA synthetase beta chain